MRVARPGAVSAGLHPAGNIPAPPWHDELPEPDRSVFKPLSFDEVTGWVTDPLQAAGISDYSLWWIDVPEFLDTPYELYIRLGGQEIANGLAYQEIEPSCTKLFNRHRTTHGVVLHQQRLLWQAYLTK